MKKTLLTLTFLQALCMAAKEKSFVEFKTDTKTVLNKNFKYQDTDTNATLNTEVVIPDSGFTFGASLQHRGQLSIFPYVLENTGILEALEKNLDFLDSNIYTKFKKDNFNAKVKLNHKLKLVTDLDYQNYNLPNIEFGVHTKTSIPLKKLSGFNPIYTTIKGFVQKDLGKFRDVRLDLETQHQIDKDTTSLGFQYIKGTLSTRYTDIKDWKFYAEANIKYQFDNAYPIWADTESVHVDCGHDHSHDHGNHIENEHDIFSHFHGFRTGASEKYESAKDTKFIQNHKFAQSYMIGAKYIGFRDFELSSKLKGYYGNNSTSTDKIVNLSLLGTFNVKYTGIKNLTIENLTLASINRDTLSSGVIQNNQELKNELSAKYKYDVNSKLSIVPEAKATIQLRSSNNNAIYLSPKITIKYKPTNDFTIEGSIKETTSMSMNKFNKPEVSTHDIKTNLGIKYTW